MIPFDIAIETTATRLKAVLASESVILRIGLIGASAFLFNLSFTIANTAPMFGSQATIFALIGSGALALVMLVGAGLRKSRPAWRWLILIALIAELVCRSAIWAQTARGADLVVLDPGLYTDLAGELLLRGQNPYAWDFAGTYSIYRTSPEASSPKLNSSYVDSFPYPPLGFLLVAPFQAAGLPGILVVSVLIYTLVLIAIFLASPRTIQPVILLPIVAGFDFTTLAFIGSTDIIWVAFVVGMIFAWQRPTWRAVLFGLAAASKQSPWLLLPFLLIRIWRDDHYSARRVGHFVVISGITFLAINLPFALWGPSEWFIGVAQPVLDSMVIFSRGGLSSLSHLGFVNLPRGYYLIAMLAIWGLLVFIYWRHYASLRNTMWIMPGIFMWFSYRSLESYWCYWTFPILAVLVAQKPYARETEHGLSWRPTAVIGAVVITAVMMVGVLVASPFAVEVRVQFPLYTTNGRVTRIQAEVSNKGHGVLTPRFAVQHPAASENPLAWIIDTGPETLQPGETATYQISANGTATTFQPTDRAEIVVTDAQGDYALRGISNIGPEQTILWPDAIPNPEFLFWDSSMNIPIYWGLKSESNGTGSLSYVQKDGRDALRLTLNSNQIGANRTLLYSTVSFPRDSFGIWLYADPASGAAVAYGLEIDDNQRCLWILFGSQPYSGSAPKDCRITQRSIPARTWTYETIDLTAAYSEVGWEIPDLKRAYYRWNLDTDLRLIDLNLLVSTDGPASNVHAYFGPIQQATKMLNPRALMEETLADPAKYYVRLAQVQIRGRNYSRALDAYEQALRFSTGDPQILQAIAALKEQMAAGSSH